MESISTEGKGEMWASPHERRAEDRDVVIMCVYLCNAGLDVLGQYWETHIHTLSAATPNVILVSAWARAGSMQHVCRIYTVGVCVSVSLAVCHMIHFAIPVIFKVIYSYKFFDLRAGLVS